MTGPPRRHGDLMADSMTFFLQMEREFCCGEDPCECGFWDADGLESAEEA